MQLFFIESLAQLFKDVQMSRLLADQKTFADSIPKREIATILKDYEQGKDELGFSLYDFIEHNFSFQEHYVEQTNKLTIGNYIDLQWDKLTRKANKGMGNLIELPYPYVVPGGRFTELFYWDSYFTMLGLQESGRWDLITDMVNNFAYLIDTFGFIPNGTRTYFLSRSQPPFFSLMIDLLAEEKGTQVYTQYLPQLEAEYKFWMNGSNKLNKQNRASEHVVLLNDNTILNRYWDKLNLPRTESYYEDTLTAQLSTDPAIFTHIRSACTSGWDFSSRWCQGTQHVSSAITAKIIPIDLNCLLLNLERTLYKSHQLANTNKANHYLKASLKRKDNINQYLWDSGSEIYVDYNFSLNKQTGIPTLAMVYPLYFKIADVVQAKSIAEYLAVHFLKSGGMLTTLNYSGEQWDAPNGWAPLQWMAFVGLKNYGFNALADQLKKNWLRNVENHFDATGKIYEKYNVEDMEALAKGGEYAVQDGFGWTNGVYLKMKNYK